MTRRGDDEKNSLLNFYTRSERRLLATLGYFPGRRPLQKLCKLLRIFAVESLEGLEKYYVIGMSVHRESINCLISVYLQLHHHILLGTHAHTCTCTCTCIYPYMELVTYFPEEFLASSAIL